MLAGNAIAHESADWRETRDQIVIENLTLVRAIAIRVHENLPVHVDLDDLIHSGVLGLFDAVERYDESKNVSFQNYAKHRIKGAILDGLRQQDWASRDLRKRQKQADAIGRELSTKLGRLPTESEVAEEMGLSLDRWRRIATEIRTLGPAPVAPPRDGEPERSFTDDLPAAPDSRPDLICEQRQLRSKLERAIDTLPKRYQKVVILYYTNEMTMKEIGDILGVNESRVSQIHKTALRKMAVALESEGIRSVEAL